MTRCRSRTENEIPLCLLPQALSRKIREWGDCLYRISVKRTHWHRFNVTVRSRPVRKELKTAEVMTFSADTLDEPEKRWRAGCRRCTV